MKKIEIIMNRNGITLVSLIITVIILFILTGVSIGIVVDNDLFDKSTDTVDKASAQIEEKNNQEKNILTTWDELPGNTTKSNTMTY